MSESDKTVSSASAAQPCTHLFTSLGTTDYREAEYFLSENRSRSVATRLAPVALAELLNATEVTVVTTEAARGRNGDELERELSSRRGIRPIWVNIPEGSQEEGQYEVLDGFVAALEKSGASEIALDITTGFRSLQFLFAAGLFYRQALERMNRLQNESAPRRRYRVFYAAYPLGGRPTREGQSAPEAEGLVPEAPIWDLSFAVHAGAWTQEIGTFLATGHAQPMAEHLSRLDDDLGRAWARQGKQGPKPGSGDLQRRLEEFSCALDALRLGKLFLGEGNHGPEVKEFSAALDRFRDRLQDPGNAHVPVGIRLLLKPLEELWKMLRELDVSGSHLGEEELVKSQVALARLYLRWGRLLEAAVVLREAAVSSVAKKGEEAGAVVGERHDPKLREQRLEPRAAKRYGWYANLSDVRNDLAHGGIRKQPLKYSDLRRKLDIPPESFWKEPAEQAARPTVWLISRHTAALEWLSKQWPHELCRRAAALPALEEIARTDWVVGNLPIHLIAELTSRRVRYFHLVLDLPPERRGHELTVEDMERYGARLEEYRAFRVEGAEG